MISQRLLATCILFIGLTMDFLDEVGAQTAKTTTKSQQKAQYRTEATKAATSTQPIEKHSVDRKTKSMQSVPFVSGGGLKMFYDNRMYPQAVAVGDLVRIVWRGKDGFPYLVEYDLHEKTFSKPQMLLDGLLDEINPQKYQNDHHYAPVIWSDQQEYLHVLFGCHNSAGIHLISEEPRSTGRWVRGPLFDKSVKQYYFAWNEPKVSKHAVHFKRHEICNARSAPLLWLERSRRTWDGVPVGRQTSIARGLDTSASYAS